MQMLGKRISNTIVFCMEWSVLLYLTCLLRLTTHTSPTCQGEELRPRN